MGHCGDQGLVVNNANKMAIPIFGKDLGAFILMKIECMKIENYFLNRA